METSNHQSQYNHLKHSPYSVISVDSKGKVLWANKAAANFLNRWKVKEGEYLSASVTESLNGLNQLGPKVPVDWLCTFEEGSSYFKVLAKLNSETGSPEQFQIFHVGNDIHSDSDLSPSNLAGTQERSKSLGVSDLPVKSLISNELVNLARSAAPIGSTRKTSFSGLNPLEVIKTNLSQIATHLKNGPTWNSEIAKLVAMQMEAIDRVQYTVDGLRAIHELPEIPAEDFSVNDVIMDLFEKHSCDLVEKEILWTFDLIDGNDTVFGHKDGLYQALRNLVINSVDSLSLSEGGCLTIISFLDGEEVVIDIVDSGIGVAIDIKDIMFDSFVSNKPSWQGSGLGLGLSRRLIEIDKGWLNFKDSEEPGAHFQIRLPLAKKS